MDKIIIENDTCFLETQIITNRYGRIPVMTKEVFQECYKKWILEELHKEQNK